MTHVALARYGSDLLCHVRTWGEVGAWGGVGLMTNIAHSTHLLSYAIDLLCEHLGWSGVGWG